MPATTITCLMPTYNNSHIIRIALDSIIDSCIESGYKWELYVLDDSTDNKTEGVVREVMEERALHIRYIPFHWRKMQPTIGEKYNVGVRLGCGEYIFQCDSDDIYPKCKVKLQADALMEGYDLSCSDLGVRWIDLRDSGREIWEISRNDHPYKINQGGTVAYTRELFEKIGGFLPVTVGSDSALGWKIMQKFPEARIHHITEREYLDNHISVDGHGGNVWKSKRFRWEEMPEYFRKVEGLRWEDVIDERYLQVLEKIEVF